MKEKSVQGVGLTHVGTFPKVVVSSRGEKQEAEYFRSLSRFSNSRDRRRTCFAQVRASVALNPFLSPPTMALCIPACNTFRVTSPAIIDTPRCSLTDWLASYANPPSRKQTKCRKWPIRFIVRRFPLRLHLSFPPSDTLFRKLEKKMPWI